MFQKISLYLPKQSKSIISIFIVKNMADYYYCPNCNEEYEENYPKFCSSCGEKMPTRWDAPYCPDCEEQLVWKKGEGWYCPECKYFPEDVDFIDEE